MENLYITRFVITITPYYTHTFSSIQPMAVLAGAIELELNLGAIIIIPAREILYLYFPRSVEIKDIILWLLRNKLYL